ncbi:MAG TPA: hypothetical protein VNU84_01460 [Candidatus Acidoferrum sp.]|nr:hypothetical protein [Candidatus Acidoferrum sp.]
MGSMQNVIYVLLAVWGVVTVVLICLMMYKSALENREEDQLFLDAAQQHIASEQRLIVQRIEKLHRPLMALMIVSGVLLAIVAGLWVYQGFENF